MDVKEKQEQLAKAINRGFIMVSQDPDGILRYTLTPAGLAQWKAESPNGSWRKFEELSRGMGINLHI
jgi:hypothetical protein